MQAPSRSSVVTVPPALMLTPQAIMRVRLGSSALDSRSKVGVIVQPVDFGAHAVGFTSRILDIAVLDSRRTPARAVRRAAITWQANG